MRDFSTVNVNRILLCWHFFSEERRKELGIRHVVFGDEKPEDTALKGVLLCKYPVDLPVIVRMVNKEGENESFNTTWGELPQDIQHQELARYPLCPYCKGKSRYDSYRRGLDKCPKCLKIDDYRLALEPRMKEDDPGVVVKTNVTGQSLVVSFPDTENGKKVSFRYSKGYGFRWDSELMALVAGKKVLGDLFDRLRPVPEESVGRLASVAVRFGLNVVRDSEDPHYVLVTGPWLKKCEAGFRKYFLSLEGSAKEGRLVGELAVKLCADALEGAIYGETIAPDKHGAVEFGCWGFFNDWEKIPPQPSGWKGSWWKTVQRKRK